jgi:hypothetical protein
MKQIPNYPNYQIDTNGNVFNKYGKIIKQQKNRGGYKYINIYNNNGPKKITIHRLMATTYLDNPLNKPQINHINGIKTDNRIDNLEWSTASENGKHSYKLGLSKVSELNKQTTRVHIIKPVLDTENGIFYDSLVDLCNYFNLKYSKMRDMLSGRTKNKTKYIYA